MLLYVDKKAEKRRKIKIGCIILCIICIIAANILHLRTALNHSHQHLDNYAPVKYNNTWYSFADTVILFSSRDENTKKIILLPKQFSKQIALTTLLALKKISATQYQFSIAATLQKNDKLKELLQNIPPFTPYKQESADVILTTDISSFTHLINEQHLYPVSLTYTMAKKIINEPQIMSVIEKIFPKPLLPQNDLEQEKQALENFIRENNTYLSEFISNSTKLPLKKQYLFLKNQRLCARTNKQTYCQTDNNLSLKENILSIKKMLHAENITLLVLLTDDKKESSEQNIELLDDEGLHFLFNGHEAFIFPEEIKTLANKQKATYIVKERAGINPNYSTNDMKFYKFKTVEVTLK